jgi:hypothetical protein
VDPDSDVYRIANYLTKKKKKLRNIIFEELDILLGVNNLGSGSEIKECGSETLLGVIRSTLRAFCKLPVPYPT